MRTKAKLLGHPVHPILVPFPIALFVTSLVFDIISVAGGSLALGTAAFWNILGGFSVGLVAAAFGFIDWLGIPEGTRAKRIGLLHMVGNVVVVTLFVVSWLTRLPAPHAPSPAVVVLEFVGVALLSVTGWLGGELVDRLGIGVDEAANPDAPSSLHPSHASIPPR